MMSLRSLLLIASHLLAVASPLAASELKIATLTEATSADPHFYLFSGNDALRRYAFESLVNIDNSGVIQPQLAESWHAIDDTHWEFHLRSGVNFQDGSTFGAEDVIYSICRIRENETQGSFARYVAQIRDIEVRDANTIVINTVTPYPLLPSEISLWAIVPAPADVGSMDLTKKGCGIASFPSNSAFDNGSRAVGTGPYRLEKFTRGGQASFTRFDGYWGRKPDWSRVVVQPITNTAARVAALLSGDVDVIEGPTPQDVARLSADARFKVAQSPNYDVRFLMFDSFAEPTPGVRGTDGKNPFKDVRVREAVSKAINRRALIDRILGGYGILATNVQGSQSFGFNPDLQPVPYDPAGSKRLLSEAGYPTGFQVTLGTSGDYEGARVAQALAQMLTQVGIRTDVEVDPIAVFFSKRAKYGYSLYSYVVGARTAETLTATRVLLGTPGLAPGFGGINGGRYSNPALDAALLKAQTTIDNDSRSKLLQESNAIAAADYALALLDQRVNLWAFRADLSYAPRLDGYTLAQDVKPRS